MQADCSVGLLYSCHNFLNYVAVERLEATELTNCFEKFYISEPNRILQLSQRCNWIIVTHDGSIEVTPSGTEILSNNQEDALRIQLRDFILIARPPWSALLPRGREEAVQYFHDDIKQCFEEAGLLSGYDDHVVQWWDELSSAARGRKNDTLTEIGRTGEKLSIYHELKRTKSHPKWVAVDSNRAGFDIQSVISSTDSTALYIEVKCSENILEHADIFVTENEWRTAKSSNNFIFHIWVNVNSKAQLIVAEKDTVGLHIPRNSQNGVWQDVKIPVRSLIQDIRMM